MTFQDTIWDFGEQPLTKQVLLYLLRDYKRPWDKISELVKQGKLVLVKRGLYIPGPGMKIAPPESFLLANHILGPSYVSMETALSHWGFIPERVYEISSATILRSKVFKTTAGRFSYSRVPLPYYAFGIQSVALTKKQTALIASPEKALCDKIITTAGLLLRSSREVMDLLTQDLRIEKEMLSRLDIREIKKWIAEAPKKNTIIMLVKTLEKL
jgi:hypothetical protein